VSPFEFESGIIIVWSCQASLPNSSKSASDKLRAVHIDKTIPANIQAQSQAERIKELERENKELKQANEIIRKAAAFFAQAELDRKPK